MFICRDHDGHLGELVYAKGYQLHLLCGNKGSGSDFQWNSHASWLGITQQVDAQQTAEVLDNQLVDWLIVDHYALDVQWERNFSAVAKNIMVIDDLADRQHECNILLDQTFARGAEAYKDLVPLGCKVLCGSKYSILRPEFSELRKYSLERRTSPNLKNILVNMGGVDKDNYTGLILDYLSESKLPDACKITVVMGSSSPWFKSIKAQAPKLRYQVDVQSGVTNMAKLMADSDLAIGAAGSTSWERCCLGLPENQRLIADMLEAEGAVIRTEIEDFKEKFNRFLTGNIVSTLGSMCQASVNVTDGGGAQRVFQEMVS